MYSDDNTVQPPTISVHMNWVTILILVVHFAQTFTTTVNTTNRHCETGWHYLGNSCYQLSHGTHTFYDAHMACLHHGADLATILNSEEDALVRNLLHHYVSSNAGRGNNSCFYIGAFRSTDNHAWLWISNHEPLMYFNFDINFDVNVKLIPCACMLSTAGFKWHKTDYRSFHHYICKKNPISSGFHGAVG